MVTVIDIGDPWPERDDRYHPDLQTAAGCVHSAEIAAPANSVAIDDWIGMRPPANRQSVARVKPIYEEKSITGIITGAKALTIEYAGQVGFDVMVATKGDDSDGELRGHLEPTWRAAMNQWEKYGLFRWLHQGNEVDLLNRPDLGLPSFDHPAKAAAWAPYCANFLNGMDADYRGAVKMSIGGFSNLPRMVGYLRELEAHDPNCLDFVDAINGHNYGQDPRLFNEFGWRDKLDSIFGRRVPMVIGEMNKSFVPNSGVSRLPEDEQSCFQLAFFIEFARHQSFICGFTLTDDSDAYTGGGFYTRHGIPYGSLQTHRDFLRYLGNGPGLQVTGDGTDPNLSQGLPWCLYVGAFRRKKSTFVLISKPTLDANDTANGFISYKYHEGMVLPGGWTSGQTAERDALLPVISAASSGNETVRLSETSGLTSLNYRVVSTIGQVSFQSTTEVTMTPNSAVLIEYFHQGRSSSI